MYLSPDVYTILIKSTERKDGKNVAVRNSVALPRAHRVPKHIDQFKEFSQSSFSLW